MHKDRTAVTEVLQERLNTSSDFKSVLLQNIFAFLVGNNAYAPNTGFPELAFCHNDAILIKQLFINCCKIDTDNIYTYFDISLPNFLEQFRLFRVSLDSESLVVFYFSGHGDRDGSLVFSYGGELNPSELRDCINSFANDTVLIVDTCYAGSIA